MKSYSLNNCYYLYYIYDLEEVCKVEYLSVSSITIYYWSNYNNNNKYTVIIYKNYDNTRIIAQ